MLNNGLRTIRGGKEKRLQNEVKKIKMVQGIKEVFGWRNNLKHNIDYNSCQKKNKNNEIKLTTQP
jgi:hypothetical protein